MTLQIIWFGIIGVLIAGYALLGGYDMGVGSLYLFNPSAKERGKMLQAIGPYWDANQVWLVTAGGAIFAAFPLVFATVFSGFYLAMVLVLLGLIMRTVSIEFRHQLNNPVWNKIWDWGFGVGSILPAFLFGVAMGNLLRGIPLDSQTNFAGTFFSLLNPYALLMGALSLTLFAWHGASFLVTTSAEKSLRERAKAWARKTGIALEVLFIIISGWTFLALPHLMQNYRAMLVLWIFPFLVMIGLIFNSSGLSKDKPWQPLLASALTILGLVGTAGASLFPRLVPDLTTVSQFQSVFLGSEINLIHLEHSLTAFNASSSPLTLTVMLIIAAIGVPIMLAYTVYVYRALAQTNAAPVDFSANSNLSQ